MYIDALQYFLPSRKVFEQLRHAPMDAVHVTVGYHETYDQVLRNLDIWGELCAAHADLIMPARSGADILAARAAGRTAILFGLQNPLAFSADISRVEGLKSRGISFCQITYNQQSLLGAGCFEPRDSGLTAFGAEVLAEMQRLGMIVDLSHAGYLTMRDVISAATRPVAITHANPLAWHDCPRNIPDDILASLTAKGGMMGFSLYPHHLAGGSDCDFADFARMVSGLVDRYGAGHFGIGSDLCQDQPDSVVNWMRNGHWRKIPAPPVKFPKQPGWFTDNRDFGRIASGLRDDGIDAAAVDGVMGQNWFDFLSAGLEHA